jgi:hypothetical protein
MGDSMHSDGSFNPFAPDDPPRDEALAELLRQVQGDVPAGSVNWDALASRISRSLPARGLTWWSYTDRWSRRILPIALAASLVGAVMLWNAEEPSTVVVAQTVATDVVADVVQGEPVEDAARSFARTMTADATLVDAEPE